MTLILSCLTPEFAYQISDRRLVTLAKGQAPQVCDDEATKAVLMSPGAMFGYTGLARLDGERTDGWLLKQLEGKRGMVEALPALASDAGEALRRAPVRSEWKRHAFVATGWDVAAYGAAPQGFIASVSNARTPSGAWLSEARDRFELHTTRPDDSGIAIDAAGQALRPDEHRALRRSLKRAMAGGERPLAVARLLSLAVRQVAARTDLVGKGLLVGIFPREAAVTAGGYALRSHPERERLAFSGEVPRGVVTFLYVPADSTEGGVSQGPHVVTPEMLMGGIVVRQGQAARDHISEIEAAGGLERVKPPWQT